MPRRFIPAAAIAALFLATTAFAAPAHATDTPPPRTLTVTGEGESVGVPDIAYIDTGVVTEGKTAGAALTANTKAMNAIFKGLEEAGIEKRDMQTSQFSVYPVYEQIEPQTRPQMPKIGGYRVQNQLTVKVRNLDALGGILDQVVKLGSNQLSGIRFAIDKPEPLIDEARQKAVADALRKAKLYAGAAGVALGPIQTITESSMGYAPQPMYAKSMMAMERDSSVPVAAGEQTLSASVTLVIRID